ncbi:MAG: ice-binding family protein [Chloroflexota bacterium]
MKNPRAFVAIVSIAFVIAIGAMAGSAAIAAGPPTVILRTASSFAVLAGAGIMNTGPSVINGDIGSFGSTTAITNFPPGIVNGTNHAGDGVTQGAKAHLVTAYGQAESSGPPTGTVSADLGGQNLVAGVYKSTSSLSLTGPVPLTLSGGPSDVWIFQAVSTLITGVGSSVVLTGGAQSCNIFWQVGSSATIEVGTDFIGTILALTSISVKTGATIDGRALAQNGAVTLDTNVITRSTCRTGSTSPSLPGFTVAPGTATPVPAPITTFTPAPVATATPIGTAASSVTPTTAPTAAPVAAVPTVRPAAVAGTQNLPATSTGDPWGPLTMLGIALTGMGILLLVRRPLGHL